MRRKDWFFRVATNADLLKRRNPSYASFIKRELEKSLLLQLTAEERREIILLRNDPVRLMKLIIKVRELEKLEAKYSEQDTDFFWWIRRWRNI